MTLARFWFLAALSAGLAAWTGGDADAATTNWVGDGHAAVRLIAAAESVSAVPVRSTLDWNSGLLRVGTATGAHPAMPALRL